jgi:hypothetical protein
MTLIEELKKLRVDFPSKRSLTYPRILYYSVSEVDYWLKKLDEVISRDSDTR